MLVHLPSVTLNKVDAPPRIVAPLPDWELPRGTYELVSRSGDHPLAKIVVGRRSVSLPFVEILLGTFDLMGIPPVHRHGLTLWLTRRPWIGPDYVSDRGFARYSLSRRRIALRTDEHQQETKDAPPLWQKIWSHFPEAAHRLGAKHVRRSARSLLHERGHDVQRDVVCRVCPKEILFHIQKSWIDGVRSFFTSLVSNRPLDAVSLLLESERLISDPMAAVSARRGSTFGGYAASFMEVGAEHFCLFVLEQILAKMDPMTRLSYPSLVLGGVDASRIPAMVHFEQMYEVSKKEVFAQEKFEWLLNRRIALEA